MNKKIHWQGQPIFNMSSIFCVYFENIRGGFLTWVDWVKPAGVSEHGQTPGKLRATCITIETCAYSLRIYRLGLHSA